MTVIVPSKPQRPVVVTVDGPGTAVAVRQGIKGETGATGPAGPQGPVGPQGPQGIPGSGGDWADLTGKPATFPPDTHTHAYGTLTGLPALFSGAYGDLTGIPGTFTPAAHNQAWSTITATPTTLAGYGIADAATAAQGALAASASQPGHTHAQADVTGLVAALAGKAATAHTHIIADTTGLQAALDGKQVAGSYAAASHSHATSDVTGLDTALAGKQPLATVLTNTTASFTTADETKLDGIAAGAQVNVATDLTYTAATRVLASSTGTDATLPLVASGDAGLAPASGGGSVNFLRADGTWAAPGGGVTNLAYNAATRIVSSDTGTDATLTIVDATNPGLAPAYPNNTTTFLRGDGTYAVPAGGGGGGASPIISWVI